MSSINKHQGQGVFQKHKFMYSSKKPNYLTESLLTAGFFVSVLLPNWHLKWGHWWVGGRVWQVEKLYLAFAGLPPHYLGVLSAFVKDKRRLFIVLKGYQLSFVGMVMSHFNQSRITMLHYRFHIMLRFLQVKNG